MPAPALGRTLGNDRCSRSCHSAGSLSAIAGPPAIFVGCNLHSGCGAPHAAASYHSAVKTRRYSLPAGLTLCAVTSGPSLPKYKLAGVHVTDLCGNFFGRRLSSTLWSKFRYHGWDAHLTKAYSGVWLSHPLMGVPKPVTAVSLSLFCYAAVNRMPVCHNSIVDKNTHLHASALLSTIYYYNYYYYYYYI
jgi:hypothetical protein